MKNIYLLYLLFLPALSFCQQKKIDSLYNLIEINKADTHTCKAYVKLINYNLFSKPNEALKLAKSQINLAKETGHLKTLVSAYNCLGNAFYVQNNYVEAIENYLKAVELLEGAGRIDECGGSYHNIANIYTRWRQVDKATSFLNKAIKINKRIKNNKSLINNYLTLQTINLDINKDYELAIKYCDTALEVSKKSGKVKANSLIFDNLSSIYLKLEKYDSALKYANWALKLQKKNEKYNSHSNIFMNLGKIYYEKGEYKKSKEQYLKAMEFIKSKKYTQNREGLYLNYSALLFKMGDAKNAYLNLLKSMEIKDSVFSLENKEDMDELQYNYLMLKKEKENELLRKSAELDKSQIELGQRQKTLFIIIILISIVVIVLLTSRFHTRQKHYKELEEKNAKIKDQNQELSELNHEMETVLQVVTHDLRTPLAKIKMLGEMVNESEKSILKKESIVKLGKINLAIGEAENLIGGILELKNLNEGGVMSEPEVYDFKASLASIINQYKIPIAKKELKLNISHQGETTVVLDRKMVNRIIDNLLSNAIKFSNSKSNIWIKSETKDNKLFLSIKDEGPGFTSLDLQNIFKKFAKISNKPKIWGTSHGLGLFITNKLVLQMNGSIKVNSSEGNGAEFMVQLLFDEDSQNMDITT